MLTFIMTLNWTEQGIRRCINIEYVGSGKFALMLTALDARRRRLLRKFWFLNRILPMKHWSKAMGEIRLPCAPTVVEDILSKGKQLLDAVTLADLKQVERESTSCPHFDATK